jgi:hypothetical protein
VEAQEMLRPIECWVNEHGSAEQQIVYADAMAKVLQDGGSLAHALDQWQRAIDITRASGASHALPKLLMTRATALIFTGRAQEGRDAIVEGRQLLHDIPEDSMSLRSFTIRLQVIDRTLGHYSSSLMLGERVLSDPAAGPAEIEEVRLPLAFAFCDLGQPTRARQLLSQARAPAGSYMALFWKEVGAQVPQPGAQLEEACRQALDAAAEALSKWAGRTLLTAWRIQARHGQDETAVAAARHGVEFASASGMQGQQLVFQALLAQRLAKLGDTSQAVWLARDSWRLMADFCPGLVYRGVVWRALIEVLKQRDAALARAIAHHAADWIFRTATEHVPPAYRESFLHRNPFNAFLLGKVRER